MSRATTVDDLTDEIFEQLARSGEMPPYLADVTPAPPDNRGSHTTGPAGTDAGTIN